MLAEFASILLSVFGDLGYFGITVLMTIESSFLPFPSEVVMIPAGYLAHEGELNIFLVVLFGTIGAILGTLVNYYLARYLGRLIVYSFLDTKWAKLILLNKRKVEKSEALFNKYGKISTFFGRLIPAVRQLISIPAGLARMPMIPFLVCTFLGAMLWNIFLVFLGWQFGANEAALTKYLHDYTIFGVIIFIILVAYIFFEIKRRKRRKKAKAV